MKTSDFDYILPPELIAQKSVQPRDNSRLMILDRKTGQIEHRFFHDITKHLKAGDLLIMNDTKVFKARLFGHIAHLNTQSSIEILLIHPREANQWIALAKPGKKLKPDRHIQFDENLHAKLIAKNTDGTYILEFNHHPEETIEIANRIGQIPVPPYISTVPDKDGLYQTVYAKNTGSVAAPTAGFHLTEDLLNKLQTQGINIEYVTLHVGLGTFQPIKTDSLEKHPIHSEWAEIPAATIAAIKDQKKRHGRIIAVGTTTVRALEGLLANRPHAAESGPFSGWVQVFIKPGFDFQIIDALITNFHLPKSTLLALVSAFAGTENIKAAYQAAIKKQYRFYSFGDAMFIN